MTLSLDELRARIIELEGHVEAELESRKDALRYHIEQGRAIFDRETHAQHLALRRRLLGYVFGSRLLVLLTAPFIYALILPFVLLDLFISLYQAVCFPVYGIEKVRRADHIVFDRHLLGYLNLVEKLNCVYCGYGNGLLSYVSEIAARTEQYWCPIKHARRMKAAHPRMDGFIDFGDAEGWRDRLDEMRKALARQARKALDGPGCRVYRPCNPMKDAAMPTFSALTTLMGEDPALALSQAVEKLQPPPVGVGVFEIEDDSGLWEVGAYFIEAPNEMVLDVLAMAYGARPFAVSEIPEIDWVAKVRRELSPVEAGRFYVFGSHDADKVPEGRVALQIEATVAFGTGHHGTTLGCLRAFDRLFDAGFRPARVADIGCGTAVLAMAAASVLPGALVIASDIDQVAVDVAQANVAINRLDGRLECVEAAGFDHPALAAASPFGLIFANILKGPLIELAPDMAAHAESGGLVILSGLLVVQAEAVKAAYIAAGFAQIGREDIGEWSTLVLQRA